MSVPGSIVLEIIKHKSDNDFRYPGNLDLQLLNDTIIFLLVNLFKRKIKTSEYKAG